jgi:uroporphyrinogen-III synthase
MPRVVQTVLHRLPGFHGLRLDRELKNSGRRRAQFVSFLESSGYRTHDVDTYERSLKRRRTLKVALVWLSAFAAAWIVLESARAVTLF